MNAWHSDEPEAATPEDLVVVQLRAKQAALPHPSQIDPRYRILVMLQRSDRPNYWIFNCPHCMEGVFELTNVEIESMSDLVTVGTNPNDILIGARCDGPYCRYYYYFKLNGIK